jgi:4a-hydroxytetrahydrobiopterin dehydratase
MSLLSRAEIDLELRTLEGWAFERGALRRQFVFGGFPDAVAFVQRLVPEAEQVDHHPDVTINYSRVTLAYVTHSQGGVTTKDIDGARMADRVAGGDR